MLGTYALSSGYSERYYREATRVRGLITDDFMSAFRKVDLIAGPTTPEPAFRIGELTDDPLAMYLSDVYTIGPSLAGCPAITLPCGVAAGLPVGLQLVGRPLDEATVIRAASAFEDATAWGSRRPEVTASSEHTLSSTDREVPQ